MGKRYLKNRLKVYLGSLPRHKASLLHRAKVELEQLTECGKMLDVWLRSARET
jgi:hypothetical protein